MHRFHELTFQRQVDYVNAEQRRVSCETFALETRADFPLVAGTYSYALPVDLAYLEAIYNGDVPLAELSIDDLMGTLSGVGGTNYVGPQGYVLIAKTLYVLPTPAAAATLDLIYYAYAPDFYSDDELTIDTDPQMVMEHLIDAEILLDGGQPEVGVAALGQAELEMRRSRRSTRGRGGLPQRMRVVGYDQL